MLFVNNFFSIYLIIYTYLIIYDAFLDLLSIVETTKKHNNSPYAAIRALF